MKAIQNIFAGERKDLEGDITWILKGMILKQLAKEVLNAFEFK